MYNFHGNNTLPPNTLQADGRPEWIFVFGSNLAGIHGAGAALVAKKMFQARPGSGYGREGLSFGIPTKDENLEPLSLQRIRQYIELFKLYAIHRQDAHEKFFVTAIGCGLAGYKHHQIAPMFVNSPNNCSFPKDWQPWLAPEQVDEEVLFKQHTDIGL